MADSDLPHARPLSIGRLARARLSPFVALCGVGFLGRLGYEMMRTPLTPLLAKHLGAPEDCIGLIVAAVTITGIFVKLPAGALSDILGRRRLMLTGVWVQISGPFLYMLVFFWPLLLIVRFYHGLATALYAPAAAAEIAKTYPQERGRRLGLYNGAETAGAVLGPVLGGVVLTLTAYNYDITAIVAGLIGVLALLVLRHLPRDQAPPAPQRATTPSGLVQLSRILHTTACGIKEILSNSRILFVSLVEAMLWMGIGSVQAYLPLYALTIHLSAWQIGMIAGAQGVASVWSRPVMGKWSDRVSSRTPFIVIGAGLCICILIALPYATSFGLLLGLNTIFGLGTGLVTPSTTALIGDLVKKGNYGSAMGVFGSLWDIGHASGPILFGFLVVGLGYKLSWLIMALIMTAALIVFLFGSRHPFAARRP